MSDSAVEATTRSRRKPVTKARILRELEAVAIGTETLASVSRKLGHADNYLHVRAQKDPDIRQAMDQALVAKSEIWMSEAGFNGQRLINHLRDVEFEIAGQGGLLPPADLDRLSRTLVNLVEVIDRSSAGARAREAARANQGADPQIIAARIAELFVGPATAMSSTAIEGELV